MSYSREFREAMVSKLLSPGGVGPAKLAKEAGVGLSTLERWKKNYVQGDVSLKDKAKKPKDWTAEEKFLAVQETGQMNEEEVGAYCRRNGLHVSQLDMWKKQCLASMRKGPKTDPEKKELKQAVQGLKKE